MSVADLRSQPFGVYEKALPAGDWNAMLTQARDAGFDFVEMSIDESNARLERLDWSRTTRTKLAALSLSLEVPIYSICLSAHRRFGLGSSDPSVRTRGAEILDAAIGLACDLGVRVIQIAGYFCFYEAPDHSARSRYIEGLSRGVDLAAKRGVMLAVENIDTSDVASVEDCLAVRDELRSPWFQIYPDVGNLALHQVNLLEQLALINGSAVGLHLKDIRPGEPRRVPFGEGDVPFETVFRALAQQAYRGPFTVEMWNDDRADAGRTAAEALRWLKDTMDIATQALAGGAA